MIRDVAGLWYDGRNVFEVDYRDGTGMVYGTIHWADGSSSERWRGREPNVLQLYAFVGLPR